MYCHRAQSVYSTHKERVKLVITAASNSNFSYLTLYTEVYQQHVWHYCGLYMLLFLCRALLFWQQNMSSVLSQTPVIGQLIDWFWPTPARAPMPSSQSGIGGTIDYIARSVSAGLLLPFAAYLVGRICFRFVKSNLRKVVLVRTV